MDKLQTKKLSIAESLFYRLKEPAEHNHQGVAVVQRRQDDAAVQEGHQSREEGEHGHEYADE